MITGKKGILFVETLCAVRADVTALAEMEIGCSSQWDILDDLIAVIVDVGGFLATQRAGLLGYRQFQIKVKPLQIIFHFSDDNIFQTEDSCGIIVLEHRHLPFFFGRGTLRLKVFLSMLNYFL